VPRNGLWDRLTQYTECLGTPCGTDLLSTQSASERPVGQTYSVHRVPRNALWDRLTQYTECLGTPCGTDLL
ncbi:hypothetical protein J6590_107095, partial [Homalodisca vitripennis]